MPVALLERQDPSVTNDAGAIISSDVDEPAAICPGCKTLETLYLSSGQLAPTRKFNQNDGHIYHDCGSKKPCHLYGTF